MNAAYATAEPTCASLAPRRTASTIASRVAAGSSSSITSTSAFSSSHSPRRPTPSAYAVASASRAFQTIVEMSIGLRHELSSSLRLAPAVPRTRLVSTRPACSQPRWSSSSNALLAKSSVCPPSTYMWSVMAAKIMSAIVCSGTPISIAVRRQRSAPSESRTSMKFRSHSLNTSARDSPVGSGSSKKRGAIPAFARATCSSPWYIASGRSAASRYGSMLALQVSIVIACPQPAAEYVVPNSAPIPSGMR